MITVMMMMMVLTTLSSFQIQTISLLPSLLLHWRDLRHSDQSRHPMSGHDPSPLLAMLVVFHFKFILCHPPRVVVTVTQ